MDVYQGLATSETATNMLTEPDIDLLKFEAHYFVPRPTDWASEKKHGDFRKSPYLQSVFKSHNRLHPS
jgi:hypothetical protein